MDKFTQAYIEAALWSSTDESREDGGDPLDDNYSMKDFSPESLEKIEKDCKQFQEENKELLQQSGQSDEQNGHDFWLTRNGHGAGFFDRDLGEIGDKLTEICDKWGEVYIYVGDDGQLYI